MPDPKPVFKRYHDLMLRKSMHPLSRQDQIELQECNKFIEDYLFKEGFLVEKYYLACVTHDENWRKEIENEIKSLKGESV